MAPPVRGCGWEIARWGRPVGASQLPGGGAASGGVTGGGVASGAGRFSGAGGEICEVFVFGRPR